MVREMIEVGAIVADVFNGYVGPAFELEAFVENDAHDRLPVDLIRV